MSKQIKLGLNIGYWAGGPPAGAVERIAEAERLGFDSVWCSEAYGSDALTPLAWWGGRTGRSGSARHPAAVRPHPGRHRDGGDDPRPSLRRPVHSRPRRVRPQVVEGWYGQPYPKPLARTREYIGIVRDDLGPRARR